MSTPTARAAYSRILQGAAVAFLVAFVARMIVGLFQ
jgi:hypothetical protein